MFKFEFKESSATLLGVAILIIAVAIIGTNPLNPSTVLNTWGRATLGTLGIILLVVSLLLSRGSFKSRDPGSVDAEYHERFRAAQERQASLTPENMIVTGITFKKVKIDVINGDILDSRADIIVSSGDNYFGARGGVAKAIMKKAGPPVAEELARYRRRQFRQGQLVVTTGGNWDCRAIIHPAVIDLDENRYPTVDVIKLLVRKSLNCTQALGARSISFPVLGGGTASKNLKPSESASALVREILVFLKEQANNTSLKEHENNDEPLTYVSLYVYDKNDASDLAKELIGLTRDPK